VESEWIQNVADFGWDLPYSWSLSDGFYRFFKAARLITPLVIGGVTYRGIIQGGNDTIRWLYLTRSDLRSWESPFNWLYRGIQTGAFPYGYVVEPDS